MRACTEKQIHQAVIETWRRCGVPNTLVATIPNMRASGQNGLTRGLPDLLVIGPTSGLIELKTLTGCPTRDQLNVLGICEMWGLPWKVTYGRDEPIAVLEEWGVLRPGTSRENVSSRVGELFAK